MSIQSTAEHRRRLVASSSGKTGGDIVLLQLNKDAIINEHSLLFAFTSTWSVAPTAINAYEVGRLIDRIRLNVSGVQSAEWYNASGLMLKPFGDMFEKVGWKAPRYSLGTTTTVNFGIEIHYENDEAKRELLTVLNGNASSQVTLQVTYASDTAMQGIFTGGTYTASSSSYDLNVISEDMAHGDVFDAAGNYQPGFEKAASARHIVKQFTPDAGSGSGTIQQDLDVGNLTRSILLYISDTNDAASDSVCTDISLVVAGVQRQVTKWDDARQRAQEMGLDATGFGLLSWHEDELGFLNLTDQRQARIELTMSAANNSRILQDYTM